MRREVTFTSEGQQCAGWLFLPDGLASGARVPAVVMANAITAVKEMYLANYGERLAAAGIAALAFDYRHYGGSEGEPRSQIEPEQQHDDIRNAISWLAQQPEVDPERIGGWGISFGGAHLMFLAPFDRRLKAIVAVVPSAVASIDVLERGMGADGAAGFLGFLTQTRTATYGSGQAATIKVASAEPEPSMVPGPLAYEFYSTAQQTVAPAWRNEVTLASLEKMMAYDPTWPVGRIAPTPLRVIAAERDEFIPFDLVRGTFERAGEPKDLVVLPCGHVDVYNTEPWLTQASDAGIEWFRRYLS
jgi:fermentation-respiration switch protein FrsA (DUF1100 family)